MWHTVYTVYYHAQGYLLFHNTVYNNETLQNTFTSDNFKWHADDDDLVSGHDSLDKDEKIDKDYNALMDNGCALCVRNSKVWLTGE